MKKILLFILAVAIFSCNKEIKNMQPKYPNDVELFNPTKDAEIATKRPPKPPKGGGNPHNPPDTTINPPPVDTSSGEVCIYLDFDGETVRNTLWNTNGDLVLTPSGLTNAQKEEIRIKVTADYAKEKGFIKSIKVTDSASVFYSYPINKRMQVIVTAYHEWYPVSAGGVAYVNSYTWGDGTPCFVFSKAYGYNEDYIAHACSHEPAHTFGCRHQAVWNGCTLISSYRPGWIMGQYNGNTSIFGIGLSNVCCTCQQDDIAIINSNL